MDRGLFALSRDSWETADSLLRFRRDALALLPAHPRCDAQLCRAALVEGGEPLVDYIVAQGVGPLWHERLEACGLLDGLPVGAIDALHRARVSAAVTYLAQRNAVKTLDRLFVSAGIPYIVFKGGHVRECAYPDPALRASADIDILISPEDRRRAADTLLGAGYEVRIKPENISHEATFSRDLVDIDLHWNMFRPGRTRVEVAKSMIDRGQRNDYARVACDVDAVFVMLTHSAFTEYVASPDMGLLRSADFLLWMQRRGVEWDAVLELLEQAGLKTAAWAQLYWFRLLLPAEQRRSVEEWMATVCPGRLRAGYLAQWLVRDLSRRWWHRPALIQLGLTLALHDRPSDVRHALHGWYQSRTNRENDERLLLG